MSKYAVYGIGNAIVDIVYNVENDFLESLNIDKGMMTLVERDQQKSLLGSLSPVPLIMKTCGGSAANTMIAISQLGGSSFYSCKVANDSMGDFYLKDLIKNGVATNLQNQGRPSGTTGSCVVLVTPDAQRSMNTYLGATATFSSDQLIAENIKDSQFLYIEGYLVSSPTGKAASISASQIARENNVQVSITLSDINMVNFFRDGLLEIIGEGVDLIFCNRDEALNFAETDDLETAKSFLKKISRKFAITLGSEGAVIFDGHQELLITSPQVQAKDSNGAGDMFAGAFLHSITHGQSFEDAGKLACQCAAKLVTISGPRMPETETKSVYRNVFPEASND